MLAKLRSRFNPAIFVILLIGLPACSGPQPDSGTEPPTGPPPVFYDRADSSPKGEGSDTAFQQFPFLDFETGALIRLQPARLAEMEGAEAFPWQFLEETVARGLGRNGAAIRTVPRIWLVFDRDSVQRMNSPEGSLRDGWLVVLDDVDPADWVNAAAEREAKSDADLVGEDVSEEPDTPPVVRAVGPRRVAIGPPPRLERLADQRSPADGGILEQVAGWGDDQDIIGLLAPGLVREMVNLSSRGMGGGGLAGGATSDPPAEKTAWSRIPDALSRVEWELQLTGDELARIDLGIDDPTVGQQAVAEFPKALQSARELAATIGPLVAGQAGPELGPPLRDLLSEFRDRELIELEYDSDQATLQAIIRRPESLSAVLEMAVRAATAPTVPPGDGNQEPPRP